LGAQINGQKGVNAEKRLAGKRLGYPSVLWSRSGIKWTKKQRCPVRIGIHLAPTDE